MVMTTLDETLKRSIEGEFLESTFLAIFFNILNELRKMEFKGYTDFLSILFN